MTTPTLQPTEKYFCMLPALEFAAELWKRLGAASAPTGPLWELQQLAYRHFYGALPAGWYGAPGVANSAVLTAEGPQGNQVAMRDNQARTNVRAQHQLVTNPALTWTTIAVNSDSASIQGAERGAQILEYLWRTGPYESMAIRACLAAFVASEYFLLTLWDDAAGEPTGFDLTTERVQYAGDLRCRPVPGWAVDRQPDAPSFEESPWLSARVPLNRHELLARYPDGKEEIDKAAVAQLAATPLPSPFLVRRDPDTIWGRYFFHKRTAACPLGLYALLLGPDAVLEFDSLPDEYADPLPLHRMAAADIDDSPWAYTDFWECLGLQDLSDDVQSALATNIITFGRQLISAESDQNLDPYVLGDGPMVLPRPKGTLPPQPLQLTAQPKEAFQHLEQLKRSGRERLGLNDIIMGQPPSAEQNAQAFALLASMAIQQNSDAQKRWVAFVTGLGRSMLKIFRARASDTRKLAITGHQGIAPVEEWTGEDLEPVDDVHVTIGNPMIQTAAGRLAVAQLYVERGFVQTPEHLETLVESGTMKPLTQGLQAELTYIAAENEQMLKGEMPPVKVTDSHQLHIREHRGGTFSVESRSDPAVNEAFDEHIRQHIEQLLSTDPRILAIMGQAAPPAPMGPGMPGAPGAGGSPLPPDGGPLASPLDAQPKPNDVEMPAPPALTALPGRS